MEIILNDFIEQMSNPGSFHAEEFLKLIRETRESGRDVWLLDDDKRRVAIVVLTESGTFRAQNIVQSPVV